MKYKFRDYRFHADCMALMVKRLRGRDKWMNGIVAGGSVTAKVALTDDQVRMLAQQRLLGKGNNK